MRDQFSAVIGSGLCSVKFHRARLSALHQALLCSRWKVSDSSENVLGQISFHRARLSELGQILSCFHAMMRRFVKYRIPQLEDMKTVTCFSYLENLRRSARNLLI